MLVVVSAGLLVIPPLGIGSFVCMSVIHPEVGLENLLQLLQVHLMPLILTYHPWILVMVWT